MATEVELSGDKQADTSNQNQHTRNNIPARPPLRWLDRHRDSGCFAALRVPLEPLQVGLYFCG
jgi:hypothetical protein